MIIYRHSGFSLVELMTTLVISSALFTISLPHFNSIILHTRADANIRVIQQSLQLARNIAINYGAPITVCPIAENKCNRDWQQGYVIFIDSGERNKIDGKDRIVKVVDAFNNQDIVQYNRLSVRFQPTGFASGTNGTLTYCPKEHSSPYSKAVVVNQAGRIRFSKKQNISCKLN